MQYTAPWAVPPYQESPPLNGAGNCHLITTAHRKYTAQLETVANSRIQPFNAACGMVFRIFGGGIQPRVTSPTQCRSGATFQHQGRRVRHKNCIHCKDCGDLSPSSLCGQTADKQRTTDAVCGNVGTAHRTRKASSNTCLLILFY